MKKRPALIILKGILLLAAFFLFIYPFFPPDRVLARNLSTGNLMEFQRSHVTRTPFNLFWAFEGLRKISLGPRFVFFIFILFLVSARSAFARPPALFKGIPNKPAGYRIPVLFLVFLSSFAFFFFFKVTYEKNILFGDGFMIPREVENGVIHPAEVLTSYTFNFVHSLVKLWSKRPDGILATQITACLAGAIFIFSLFGYTWTLGKNKLEKLALFFGLATPASVVMFFGYVETTCLELAALAFYLFCGVKFLSFPSFRLKLFCLSLAGLALVLMFHAGGTLVLPSLAFLLFEKGNDWRHSLQKTFSPKKLILVSLFVLIPYFLVVVKPFYWRGNFGNIKGGGDGIALVPLSIDYASPPSRFVHYSLFSPWHFSDIISIVVLCSFLALPMVVLAGFPDIKNTSLWAGKNIRHFLLSSLGTAAIPLLWNHDFGMWGDWNISAAYLFPLNVFLYTRLILFNRKSGLLKVSDFLTIILIQSFLTYSFYLQFR